MAPETPVIGPHSLVQSWDRPTWWTLPGRPRRLEALIGSLNQDGTLSIHHHFRGQQRPDNPWLRGDLISSRALAPAALSQRGRSGTRSHELVAHISEPEGLIEYAWSVNAEEADRWRRIGTVAAPSSQPRPIWDGPEDAAEWGDGTVIATATAATGLKSGWVQALVQVNASVYHLHRQERAGRVRWLRHACLRVADPEPFAVASESSSKVAQVSGERDSQPRFAGDAATLSASESRSGVRGTDLGVRIDHDSSAYLLFGDTHWTRRRLGTRDAIARVEQAGSDRPRVTFHGSPMSITGGRVTTREYDVPLDAFSLDGELYAFFTSDHFRDAQVMGRSVLARAPRLAVDPDARRRPLRFRHLGTFSSHRFINVSVQRVAEHLYLWGSGAYRADDLRLARVDLATPGLRSSLRNGSADAFLAAVRYWAGNPTAPAESTGQQHWSTHESDARPLFGPGAHGEVSVRWVAQAGRFLMLSMSGPDDPIGPAVSLRTARNPWGPWSPRLRLFDWIALGMSFADPVQRFIRALSDGTDPVGDAIFRGQANATGAAYAPYLFDVRPSGPDLLLRYTLSTWNPYQVVLMQHRIRPGDLELVQP